MIFLSDSLFAVVSDSLLKGAGDVTVAHFLFPGPGDNIHHIFVFCGLCHASTSYLALMSRCQIKIIQIQRRLSYRKDAHALFFSHKRSTQLLGCGPLA